MLYKKFEFTEEMASVLKSGYMRFPVVDGDKKRITKAIGSYLIEEEKKLISKVRELYKAKAKISYTVWKYCLSCPIGVAQHFKDTVS